MSENERPQFNPPPTDESPVTEPQRSTSFIIVIVIAVIAVIAIVTFFLFFNKQNGSEQQLITEREVQEKTGTAINETIQQTGLAVDGYILFVKDGDLWQMSANGANAVKLIDLDTVQRASRSPVSNRIAYTLAQSVTKTVTEHDGTVRDVEVSKHKLLLADEKGFDSFLVHDNVSRWGWITASDLLWYETAALQQFFAWEYRGDGNAWIFNTATRKAEKLNDSDRWSLLRAEWSPDGNKLMFAGSGVLRVADRRTKTITKIFQIPYVGGDRGGPQPIPYFAWAPDSSSIYAIFSPLPFLISGEELSPDISLKAKHITVLRFPLDGGKPTKLMPEVPSTIISEESYPRAHFSDDFSKAIYPRAMQSEADLALAIYDLAEQKEHILLENPGVDERGLMPSGVPLAWVVGNSAYIFRGDGDWLYSMASIALIKVNYRTGASETLASRDGVSGHISNILFLPKSETLLFTSSGKLYSMNQDGVVPIADGLGDFSPQVEYHLE